MGGACSTYGEKEPPLKIIQLTEDRKRENEIEIEEQRGESN
jgi:hypothetical protein